MSPDVLKVNNASSSVCVCVFGHIHYKFTTYFCLVQPDISAPGVNILAAWPPKTSPTLFLPDSRSVNWNFQSGTSMSCPHVTGVVSLIKSLHPDWSPAAIKSALITTGINKQSDYVVTLVISSVVRFSTITAQRRLEFM